MLLRGLGGGSNHYEARKAFLRACGADHAHACTLLAEVQVRGEGGSQDLQGAMQSYRKACLLKAKVGCERYNAMKKILSPKLPDIPTPPDAK
jgi:TPR repeat protein